LPNDSCINICVGSSAKPRNLYHHDHSPDDMIWDFKAHRRLPQLSRLRGLYPELSEILQMASERCNCGCLSIIDTDDDEGCLQTLVASHFFQLIGHSLADAAGISDISNLRTIEGVKSLVSATKTILVTIPIEGRITWRNWFELAASAATGLPQTSADSVRKFAVADANHELIAWTCGSMTVVPVWLDINRPIELQHSWGVLTLTGTPSSLIADKAVIESQPTTQASKDSMTDAVRVSLLDDTSDLASPVDHTTSVIASNGILHRMMTLVSTPTSMRIIDPSAIYRGHMSAVQSQCSHRDLTATARLTSFDHVLRYWKSSMQFIWSRSDPQPSPKSSLFVCKGPGAKLNIAIGLSVGRFVMHTEQSCLQCAVDLAGTLEYNCISTMGGKNQCHITAK
jgi:hypothetical protein